MVTGEHHWTLDTGREMEHLVEKVIGVGVTDVTVIISHRAVNLLHVLNISLFTLLAQGK